MGVFTTNPVMKFDSKSVLFNRGINHRVNINVPSEIDSYIVSDDVWKWAIEDFNKKLDKRPLVTMHIGDLKLDILRLARNMQSVVLWLVVKEKDLDVAEKIHFSLKGEVIFAENSDTKVDKMIIKDIMYGKDEGIFTKKS